LYDKVPDGLLKKWNGLSGNEVKTGQYLIVGWLKARKGNAMVSANNTITASSQLLSKEQSVIASKEQRAVPPEKGKITHNNSSQLTGAGNANNNNGNGVNPNNSNNAFLSEVIASENSSRNIHTASPPPDEDNDAFSVRLNKPKPVEIRKSLEKLSIPKEEKKTVPEKRDQRKKQDIRNDQETVQPQKPEKPDSFDIMLNRVTESARARSSSQQRLPTTSSQPASSAITQPARQDVETQAPQTAVQVDATSVTEPATAMAGEFEQQYEQQTNNGANVDSRKGAAGWFKSNVKPGSGRYYALCNDLPRGSIVKVINPLNKKSILVKVLDVIPQGAENYKLIIKISDAAM
ncbi:MAG: hypothetical protein ACRDE2_17730, partial [Chitinophagaceae bacterium]